MCAELGNLGLVSLPDAASNFTRQIAQLHSATIHMRRFILVSDGA
jgi:hypothetical protein